VQGETGFRARALYICCTSESELAYYETWLDKARIYQVDARMLSSEEVAKLLPGASRTWLGGIYSPSAGRAEPQKSRTRDCQRCAPTRREHTHTLRVRGVETTAGASAAS
jgi:glycine/D-amino acid oxidase-like deaminating enzyme